MTCQNSNRKRRKKSRGNGTGTAFKRGSTWTAQVVVGWKEIDPEKPVRAITRSKGGFKTRDAALQYCPILKAGGVQKQQETPVLEHYWETYKNGAYKALSYTKKANYKTAWNRLASIHNIRIDQLTVADLQNLIDKKCPTHYTAKECKTLLMALFRIAAAEGKVRQELPTFIQLPTLDEKERQTFSETEQAALWKLYESGDLRAATPLLMIYTGMMPGEAMQLRVENIDLEKRVITGAGLKTKVRKASPIVLAENILPVVEDLIAHARPSGRIWVWDKKVWYKDYYDVLAAAKCRKLSPYCCRHTTATALAVTKNIAPQTVRKVMRWSSAKMLDRYAHPQTDDALAAVNALSTSN